jgi:hypothetical protein
MWSRAFPEVGMQLSELLGCTVRDAGSHEVGTVVDVRLNVTGDLDDSPSAPTLFGLIVSPRTRSSYLGYERSEVNRPMALAVWSTPDLPRPRAVDGRVNRESAPKPLRPVVTALSWAQRRLALVTG